MNDTGLNKIRDKIIEGIKISARKMLESKKKLGHRLVISEKGKIRIIEASDL
jgi:hypothetical protein